jgi:osmotically-inducible protein OsmY
MTTLKTSARGSEQIDDEIRQAISLHVDGSDTGLSVLVEQGRVTLLGDAMRQEELAELADALCSIRAITQIQTRFRLH